MRKLLAFLLCFACIGTGLYFFRGPLAVKGVEWALSRALPSDGSHDLHYETAQFDHGRLVVRGLQLVEENFSFLIDETEVTFDFDLKQLRILGHVQLNHPMINLGQTSTFSNKTFSTLLIPSKRLSLSVEAKGGILEIGGGRYYFQMHSSGDTIPEGMIAISQDPSLLDHPFFNAHWTEEGGKCVIHLKIDPIVVDHATSLVALALKPVNLELTKGIAEMSGCATLSPMGELESFSGKFSCEELEFSRGALSLNVEHLDGTYTDGLGLALNLSGGEVVLDGHLYASDVACRRLPDGFAKWKIQGRTTSLGPFSIEGEERDGGAEGRWFFSDMDATVNVAINSFEPSGYLATFSIEGWNGQQAQALLNEFSVDVPSFNDLTILDGEINGRCSIAIEEGVLTSIDLESLTAKNARFTLMNKVVDATTFSGEGRFTPFGEGEMRVDILGTLGLDALAQEPAQLSASFKIKRGTCEVSGAAKFGEESVQFGFESRRVIPRRMEEIFEAWIRADKLSPKLYGPVVSAFSQSCEIEGIFDLFGTFDGEKLELSLQTDAMLLHHPWADMKAQGVGEKDPMLLKTAGRATVTYHLSNRCFRGQLPLSNAALYQRHTGLVFDHMTGVLTIHHDADHQSFSLDTVGAKGYFDGKPLLKEIKSSVRGDLSSGEIVFDEFKGHAILPMEGEYYLSLPTLKRHQGRWDAEALLFDSAKTTLATLSAVAEKEFSAAISLGKQLPLSGELKLGASFDKSSGATTIVCESDDLRHGEDHLGAASVRIKNQGSDWKIESVKWGNSSLTGAFALRDDGWKFEEVVAHIGEAFVQGSGMVFVDFPTEQQPFSLRAELLLDGELHNPMPLQFHTLHPVKVAYSPSMGMILSNLDLELGSSRLTIAHMQATTGKWHAHNCQYLVREGLLRTIKSNGYLPELVKVLSLPNQLEGTLNLDWEKGVVKVQGVQETGPYQFELGSGRDWSLTLGETAHCCQLNGWVKDGEVTIEMIKGEIAGQQLDLKGGSMQSLVGTATLDFAALPALVSVPASLQQTKLGSGFRLDGAFSVSEEGTLGFKGRCRGSEFEAFGYQLRSLDAKAELTDALLKLENCIVIDDAGKFTAQQILFSHGIVELPRGELKNFQPSFLRPLDGPEKLPSTLMIKTAFVEEFRGTLGQPETFRGKGSLRFSGAPGALQLPSELAGSGWNQSHFTPVSGEADYELGQGKCFLTALRDCHSEKESCTFSLVGTEDYFDFDGNLCIDVQLQESQGAFLDLELRGSRESLELKIR
ncbi:MAG: hypothetical protein K940chlam2_00304 [Chlamydiae bacterium]|nr:hypothetical protein [Chlamydiota bacterium]